MASLGVVHTPADRPPTDVADLLAGLLREPGRPRLTWYGPDGERIELSGAVLVNWVNKTTNLLVEEFDAGPGTRVLLDLPGHWRAAVWALAVWRAGACVVDGSTAGPSDDVVVTCRPAAHPVGTDVVAVSLPGLARSWPGTLPPGAIDAAAAVMTYADELGPTPPSPAEAPAVDGPVGSTPALRYDELLDAAAATATTPQAPGAGGGRVLVPVAPRLRDTLLRTLGVWASDGSVVLLAAETVTDGARVDRLIRDERVTARLG